jgi:RNA polymerase sigma-70 factor (ECF subfamily)
MTLPPKDNMNSVAAFLSTIVKHDCLTFLDKLNRRSRREQTYNAEIISLESVELPNLSSLVNEPQGNSYAMLHAALKQINPAQSQSLSLLYFENYSYLEIAEAMEIDISKVKSHIQNGKKRLRKLLTDLKR